jgi:hypothetical protein
MKELEIPIGRKKYYLSSDGVQWIVRRKKTGGKRTPDDRFFLLLEQAFFFIANHFLQNNEEIETIKELRQEIVNLRLFFESKLSLKGMDTSNVRIR